MKPRTAIALVVTAAALWGTTGTAQALGPDGIDPLAVGTFRLAVAAPALWVIASFLGEAPRPPLPRPSLLIAGAAMASYQPWFFSAVEPLAATLLGVVILGETLTGGTLLGAAALGVGLIVVSADELGQRRQGADVAH